MSGRPYHTHQPLSIICAVDWRLNGWKNPSALRLESVTLPASRLDESVRQRLAAIVGTENCRYDQRERVLHSAGKGYKDLLRLRRLALDKATDVVVYPRSEAEVGAVLACCRELRLAVVPFGGGTSVVGGLEPETGEQRLVVTLDLALLNRVMRVDTVSQTVTVEAGIFGPELEARLAERGLTLGHFPQSFEYSTLGGWIATRSSGQNSLSYGGIDKLVESLRIVTPEGTVETLHVPRRADGPDVSQMLDRFGRSLRRHCLCDSPRATKARRSRLLDVCLQGFSHGTRGESLFGAIRRQRRPSCELPTRKKRRLRSPLGIDLRGAAAH